MWNNSPTSYNDRDNLMRQMEEVEEAERESPYFERTTEIRGNRADVIVIDDEEEEEEVVIQQRQREEEEEKQKKKLSLEQYRNMKQMKIFEFSDHHRSPTPQHRGKEDDEGDLSDREAAEDLDSSRYDNLNRPNCLDESEGEEDEEDEEVVIVNQPQEQEEEETEEEDEKENERKSDVQLADALSGVKIKDSPQSSPAAVLKTRQQENITTPENTVEKIVTPKQPTPPVKEESPKGIAFNVTIKHLSLSKM